MKRIEENGRTYYEFEPHEHAAEKAFRDAVGTIDDEEFFSKLLGAYMEALDKRKKQQSEAWGSITKAIGAPSDSQMVFNHFTGRVELLPTDEQE